MSYDPDNLELREQFHEGFIRGVETDPSYPTFFADQEDMMFYEIGDAIERGLMTDDEGHELFCSWALKRRNAKDTIVIRVDQRVAKPFYE